MLYIISYTALLIIGGGAAASLYKVTYPPCTHQHCTHGSTK